MCSCISQIVEANRDLRKINDAILKRQEELSFPHFMRPAFDGPQMRAPIANDIADHVRFCMSRPQLASDHTENAPASRTEDRLDVPACPMLPPSLSWSERLEISRNICTG